MHGQDRVVTGHAAGEITHSHGEERPVVSRCCRWSPICGFSRSSNVQAVLRPLIVQWRCAYCRHAEAGSLPCPDRRVGWLYRDCRRITDYKLGVVASCQSE